MKTDAAIKFYGSVIELAQALGVTQQAIYKWRGQGLLPKGVACEVHIRSGYRVPINLKLYG